MQWRPGCLAMVHAACAEETGQLKQVPHHPERGTNKSSLHLCARCRNAFSTHSCPAHFLGGAVHVRQGRPAQQHPPCSPLPTHRLIADLLIVLHYAHALKRHQPAVWVGVHHLAAQLVHLLARGSSAAGRRLHGGRPRREGASWTGRCTLCKIAAKQGRQGRRASGSAAPDCPSATLPPAPAAEARQLAVHLQRHS